LDYKVVYEEVANVSHCAQRTFKCPSFWNPDQESKNKILNLLRYKIRCEYSPNLETQKRFHWDIYEAQSEIRGKNVQKEKEDRRNEHKSHK
jgi:hypothetical protein